MITRSWDIDAVEMTLKPRFEHQIECRPHTTCRNQTSRGITNQVRDSCCYSLIIKTLPLFDLDVEM